MKSGGFSPDHDGTPPTWFVHALREPVTSRPEARTRIMAAVRALPAPHRLSAPRTQHASRWRRRGSLTGLGGVLLTATLMMAVTVRHGEQREISARVQPSAMVLGDSAVPVRGADSLVAMMHGRLLDTMKVVEYVVHGRDVRAVQVRHAMRDERANEAHVVPFEPTQLTRVSDTEWRVRALLPRDAVAVSFQVNEFTLDPVPVRELATEL